MAPPSRPTIKVQIRACKSFYAFCFMVVFLFPSTNHPHNNCAYLASKTIHEKTPCKQRASRTVGKPCPTKTPQLLSWDKATRFVSKPFLFPLIRSEFVCFYCSSVFKELSVQGSPGLNKLAWPCNSLLNRHTVV